MKERLDNIINFKDQRLFGFYFDVAFFQNILLLFV